MACTVDTMEMKDQDLSIVSPSSNKHVPKKFKKPASRIPPPFTLDELYESTDASTITPAHPRKGFKLTKKTDTDLKGFSKAFETTQEDESTITCAQLEGNPFNRNFRSRREVKKKNATFSKAFEISTDQDLTLDQKELISRAANFRSNKEKAKSNFTFSKGFESSCRNDSSLHLSQPTKVQNFKRSTKVLECDFKFSQALESAICTDLRTLLLNDDETSDVTPNPIEQFAQTLSNISPILPEEIKHRVIINQDFSTKSSRHFSTNLSEISEESFSNDADTSSAADDSNENQKTVCSLSSKQLTPIVNTFAASSKSFKIKNDARDRDSSSELGDSNVSPSPLSPVRKKCREKRSSELQYLKKYWRRRTHSQSTNAFTDHDLSLHLLSKCLRPKKPLPVSVKTFKEESPISAQKHEREFEEICQSSRLKRPAYWATNKLYNFIKENIITESDSLSKMKTEHFVNLLAKIVNETIKTDDVEERAISVNKLKSLMIEYKLVKSDFYFYHFIQEFLPCEFIDLAVPSIVPFSDQLNVPNYKPGNLFKRYFS